MNGLDGMDGMDGMHGWNIPIVDHARLDANWRAITAELDTPRASRTERLLRGVGFPASVTRVVVATPALRRAWFLAVGVAVLVGLGAARPDDPDSLFALLVLAPIVPVLGVAMAFGPAADPLYEVQLATPMRGLRLVAIRATTVLIVSVAVIGALSVLSPNARPMAAAWLLPALALTTGSLAAMTVLTPRQAAAAVTAVWLSAVLVAQAVASDPLAAFGVAGQLAAIAVATAAGVVVALRRASFDRLEHAT